jgi:Zn-dependent metalloprotease
LKRRWVVYMLSYKGVELFIGEGALKTCPFCKEDVRDDAIKCRHCQSMLLPAQPLEPPPSGAQPTADRVTYILDRDLVRFAKFAAGALALFLVVGSYVFGFKLETAVERLRSAQDKSTEIQQQLTKTQAELSDSLKKSEEIQKQFAAAQAHLVEVQGKVDALGKDVQDHFDKVNVEMDEARKRVSELGKEVEANAGRSKTSVTVIEQYQEKMRTLVDTSAAPVRAATLFDQEQASRLVEVKIMTAFKQVLSPKQYSELEKAIKTPVGLQRAVYDAEHAEKLPGKLVRLEGQAATADDEVTSVYENLGNIQQFFQSVFGRDLSHDLEGPLIATVHYDVNFNNAFWNGQQIVVGDGDGQLFKKGGLSSLPVLTSEIGHLVTSRTSKLIYEGGTGALNTHISDVYAVLVEQWLKKQTVEEGTWLVGEGVFAPGVGVALRSLKAPGTAYDSPTLGKDAQPAHMKDYRRMTDDNGGVHINSGIPNRAFYEVANMIGGHAWEKPAKIWYQATLKLKSNATFADFSKATYVVSGELYGAGSSEQTAVKKGWQAVGINPDAG